MRAAVTAVIIEMALSTLNFLTCSLRAVNMVIAKERLWLWRSRTRQPLQPSDGGVDPPVEFSVVMAQTRRKRPHEPMKASPAHRHLRIPMLQVDDDRERHPDISGKRRTGRVTIGDQGQKS
jgi:hypothetical protein